MNFFYKLIADYNKEEEYLKRLQFSIQEIYFEVMDRIQTPEQRLLDQIGIDDNIKYDDYIERKSSTCFREERTDGTLIINDEIYYDMERRTLNFYKTEKHFIDDNPFQCFSDVTVDDLKAVIHIDIKTIIEQYQKNELKIKQLNIISIILVIAGICVTVSGFNIIIKLIQIISYAITFYLIRKTVKNIKSKIYPWGEINV